MLLSAIEGAFRYMYSYMCVYMYAHIQTCICNYVAYARADANKIK